MTRWSAITRTRDRRSALAYGSRSTTAAEDNLSRLIHHEPGRYFGPGSFLGLPGSRRVNQNAITARSANASIEVFSASSWICWRSQRRKR